MQKSILPKALVTKLIEVVGSMTELHSIFLLRAIKDSQESITLTEYGKDEESSYRYSLTIVVITKGGDLEYKKFMSQVYTKMNALVQIFPILYTINDVKHRLDHGDNFLYWALLPKNRIYQTTHDIKLGRGTRFNQRVYDEIDKEWKGRMKRANYFAYMASNDMPIGSDNHAIIFLLSLSIQHACAALLAVFWELKPSYYEFHYLLNLCSHFSKSPEILFPKRSFRSHNTYALLRNVHHDLIFNLSYDISENYCVEISTICSRFLKHVEKEGEKELECMRFDLSLD